MNRAINHAEIYSTRMIASKSSVLFEVLFFRGLLQVKRSFNMPAIVEPVAQWPAVSVEVAARIAAGIEPGNAVVNFPKKKRVTGSVQEITYFQVVAAHICRGPFERAVGQYIARTWTEVL